MITKVEAMRTTEELNMVRDFLSRNRYAIPEELEATIKTPSDKYFYVFGHDKSDDVIAVAEIAQFYADWEPDEVMHIRFVYMHNGAYGTNAEVQFLKKILDLCRKKDIPAVVLTSNGITPLSRYGGLGFRTRHVEDLHYAIATLRSDWPFPTLVPRTDGEPF